MIYRLRFINGTYLSMSLSENNEYTTPWADMASTRENMSLLIDFVYTNSLSIYFIVEQYTSFKWVKRYDNSDMIELTEEMVEI